MRPLIFIALLLIITSTNATDVGVRYSHYKKEVGTITNRRFQTIDTKIMQVAQGIEYADLEFKLSVEMRKNDFSQYIIRRQDGSEQSLEEILGESPDNLVLSTDMTYYLERAELNTALFADVIDNPFRRYGGSVSYRYALVPQLASIFIKGLYYWQHMPEDYFIDSNFKNCKRAELLHVYSFTLGGEIAVSQVQKLRGVLLFEDKKGERPRHWGGRLASAYAFTENVFWRVELSYIKELYRDALEDERGYYSFSSISNTVVWEPFFEVFLSLGYVFTREIEDDPRIDSKLQTGSDTYFFKIKHPIEWGELELDGHYSQSNREESLYDVGVLVSWDY